MIKQLILEGVQEQSELRKLRDEMLDYFAVQNAPAICYNFNRFNNDKEKLKEIYGKGQGLRIWEFKVLDSNINIENYQILRDFLYNYQPRTFGLEFDVNMSKENAGTYYYGNNQIKLNFYPEYFIEILEFQEGLDCPSKVKQAFSRLYGKNLLHELQHAYDAFRSKNLYAKDKRSKKYYKKLKNPQSNSLSDKEMDNLYLSLPHEYWARFSEFIGSIFFAGKPSFSVYLKVFKENFEGWDVLKNSDKIRLIKALYKYYTSKFPNKKVSPKL